MSEGPKRAPTSPPLTPEPRKRQRSAYCLSRPTMSVQRLLPQSTHDVVGLDDHAEELLDDGIHRRPRLDEDEDLARLLERGDELG